jgi:Flp pilus assembly protein TadG
MPKVSRKHSRQRGAIIVWFALFMMTMLSFAALGIDIAKLAATRTQLQNAADAAALAGASAVDPETGKIQAALAVVRAQKAGEANEAFIDSPKPVMIDPADVELLDNNRVRVTVRRQGSASMVTTMAQVLGIRSLESMAIATAQADTAQSVCNVAPLGILPPRPGHTYAVGCGNTYTFKPGTLGGGDGNYRALLLPPCSEGPCADMTPEAPQTFLCQLKHGYRCCITIKEWIFLERGRDIGLIRSGIDDRFEMDTDRTEGICYADYHGNGSRIMFVPITTIEVPGDSGVWVTGMAAFFIKYRLGGVARGALIGEFIHAVAPGTPNGHPETGGPVAFALHLVR